MSPHQASMAPLGRSPSQIGCPVLRRHRRCAHRRCPFLPGGQGRNGLTLDLRRRIIVCAACRIRLIGQHTERVLDCKGGNCSTTPSDDLGSPLAAALPLTWRADAIGAGISACCRGLASAKPGTKTHSCQRRFTRRPGRLRIRAHCRGRAQGAADSLVLRKRGSRTCVCAQSGPIAMAIEPAPSLHAASSTCILLRVIGSMRTMLPALVLEPARVDSPSYTHHVF